MQYFHISDMEREKVFTFRDYIRQHGFIINLPDELLYRYLVSSGYKMAPALSKVLRMMNWRSENKIDTLLHDNHVKKLVSILSKKLKFVEHGHDRLYCPLTIIAIGSFSLCNILMEFEIEDILLVFFYYTEYIERKAKMISKQMSRDYTGNVTIMDMKGLSLRTHFHPKAIAVFKTLVLASTYYYPESCQRVFIINSPPIFSYFWKLIFPLMTELQHSKMILLDRVEDLFEYFSFDQIPKHYGGLCQCQSDSILFDTTIITHSERSGYLTVSSSNESKLLQKVNEGDHIMISFSSVDINVVYSVYSVLTDGSNHYYCNQRVAESITGIINVSYIIVTTGDLFVEFFFAASHGNECVIGYEITIQ